MPHYCRVSGCKNSTIENKQCSFFQLPVDPTTREQWIQFAGVDDNICPDFRICTNHFEEKCFKTFFPRPLLHRGAIPTLKEAVNKCSKKNTSEKGRPAELTDINNPDWIPSKNLDNAVVTDLKRPSTLERPSMRRKKVKIAESVDADSHLVDDIVIDEIKVEIEEETGTASQTDFHGTEIDRLREELRLAKEEIAELKKRQKKSDLSEESLPNDDRKTLYFTGIDIPDLPRVICTPHIRAVIRSHSDEISRI